MFRSQVATKIVLAFSVVMLAVQTVFIVWYYFAAFKPHCL